MALNVYRLPGMDEAYASSPGQILRRVTKHGAQTTAFAATTGQLEAEPRLDAVIFNYDRATYPFQNPSIAPLDALIHRAKSKAVHQVIVDGEVTFENGDFAKIEREAVLAQIAEALSQPRDEDEFKRLSLREEAFPTVPVFHDGYLKSISANQPFYRTSSRR